MYKTIICAALAAMALQATASELKMNGRGVDDLVPAGWERTEWAKGDVNHDGINDLVIMSTPDDSENMYVREDGYKINMNEPIVAIYMGKADGTYRLYRTAKGIVPNQSETFFTENLAVKVNSKGVINITYSTFASAGSWSNETVTRTYRYQNGDVYLIGDAYTSLNRATLDIETESYNYMTGRKCTEVKRNEGRSPKAKWEKIKKEPLSIFGK